MTKIIMVQGAGSNVGKSMVVAGLCRHFRNKGLRVRPFKPQNMSNNAAVTVDGGEIGRAQAMQATACGVDPIVDMNPVLLKPETDIGAQVIVQGKRYATLKAREYAKAKPELLKYAVESFKRIAKDADLVVIEGAGSPAEINLRKGDIANMGFAEAVNAPVVLLGDIDRGGVIAQLVGTHAVLPASDRDRVTAYMVNKFRGDVSLFDQGLVEISNRTGWQSLGVLPWFEDAWKLPAEDVMDIASKRGGDLKIVVPRLSRIANFDDLDPLSHETGVSVEIIEAGRALPGDADLVLLPGSKSTIGDLEFLRAHGWDTDIFAHVRRGGHVIGICGGYQMLGRIVSDPEGIEGSAGAVAGLGLLDVTTVMTPKKQLSLVEGREIESDTPLTGYEIHIGETGGPDCARPWLEIGNGPHGAMSKSGKVRGCYLHGLFASNQFRQIALSRLGHGGTPTDYALSIDETLDRLADHMGRNLDCEAILELAVEYGSVDVAS